MYRTHVNNKMFSDPSAFDCVVPWGPTYAVIECVRFDRNGWVSELDIMTEKNLDGGIVQTITDRDKIEAFCGRWLAEFNRDRFAAGLEAITPRAYKNRYEPVTLRHALGAE